MIIVFASSVVDRGFKYSILSNQRLTNISWFSATHTALKSKGNDWLVDTGSE